MEGNLDYGLLAQALIQRMAGVTTKAVSSTPSTVMGHGPGGLFSHPALERPVFSAMTLPNLGLASLLPIRPSNDTNPLYGIVTGVTATTGSEPNGVCDDPPTVGLMKLCTHSFVFGRQSRQTRVFDLDSFGRRTGRGEHADFQLFGNPFGGNADDNPNVPTLPGAAGAGQALNNEIAKVLFEFAVAWSRDFARELYTGNPANNTAGGGRKYFYGLNTLINTGYRDAETGVACPAADSIISSFQNQNVATAGGNLVRQITSIYRNLQFIATETNLAPVRWGIAMRWGLFYEITEVWPIAYSTYRVNNVPAGSTQFVDSMQIERMRDDMRGDLMNRTGQYLLIDGQKVPVVIDDGIVEDGIGAGTMQSDIYFVPMTVLGNTPVTYLEYFNYNAAGGAMDAAKVLAPGDSYYTTDDGRFFWHKKPPTNFCVQILAKTEPRLLLLTPFLAARLTNIRYSPLMHERDPFTDSAYFVDGGRTDRGGFGPSYYTPTA